MNTLKLQNAISEVTGNTQAIPSDCNAISFNNTGNVDANLTVNDSQVLIPLNVGGMIVIELDKNSIIADTYSITFSSTQPQIPNPSIIIIKQTFVKI